jgi:hypothetical protein
VTRRARTDYLAIAVALGAVTSACAPAALGPPSPTAAEWTAARARLDALREAEPTRPYGIVVRVTLREPRSGRSFAARGALAVDPHRAMRMILLGPGGTTAIDAWITPDAYRFEVPPLGLLRRGGREADPALPVTFFRWWFLAPVEGRLLASYPGPSLTLPYVAACTGRWFILRRGTSTVTLCEEEGDEDLPRGGIQVLATERSEGTLERLSFHGKSLAPHAGDEAEYQDAPSGVRAHVEVESYDADAPDPVAFMDPDHGGAR